MDVILTDHAVSEFKRHNKSKGTRIEVLRALSSFFSRNPYLVHAKTYTLQRKGKQPRLKGPTMYLARGSWNVSKVLLLLVSSNRVYTAVTTLSGREFKSGVRKKRIIDISERPVDEDLLFINKELRVHG